MKRRAKTATARLNAKRLEQLHDRQKQVPVPAMCVCEFLLPGFAQILCNQKKKTMNQIIWKRQLDLPPKHGRLGCLISKQKSSLEVLLLSGMVCVKSSCTCVREQWLSPACMKASACDRDFVLNPKVTTLSFFVKSYPSF